MKQQSRNGVFETNSSSIHTISIYNNDDYKENMKKTTSVYFGSGEYGWANEVYPNSASYLWTGLVYSNRYKRKEIEKIKKNITKVLKKHKIKAEFEPYVVKTYMDSKDEYLTFDNWKGYVDHTEDLPEFFDYIINIDLSINEEHLLRYLFNSYVCTGNDNDESGYANKHREEAKDGITLFVKGN